MKLAALMLAVTAAVPAPEPLTLDAQAQMELTHLIAKISKERDEAQREASYWYQEYRKIKKTKGVCI